MTMSLRLSKEDTEMIKGYADFHGISVSDLFRQAVIEKIENEIDLQSYREAIADLRKNQKTYTLDEVEKELGLK